MGTWIQEKDVQVWIENATSEKITHMIDLAEGQALAVAPQLAHMTLTPEQEKAVKGILLAAIRRWWDAGSGAIGSRTVGPFSETIQSTAIVGQLYPSEIKALGRISGGGRVFSFSMDPCPEDKWPAWVVNAPEREDG